MKAPDLVKALGALAIAISFGFARDATSYAGHAQPKMIEASVSQARTESRSQSETGWTLQGTQRGTLPASKDANPER
jgi:hypothetical protein